jgi:phosphoribosyl 1,2-cyclic phosphate phosphodiesterase
LTIEQACTLAEQVEAKLTLFTHLCHEAEHETVERELPAHVRVAYDEMQIEVTGNEIRHIA